MKICFNFNQQKAQSLLGWVKNNYSQLDDNQILVAVFKSEINHLQKYGRPILGDKYFGTKEFAYGYYLKNLVENNEEKKYKPKFFSHSDIEILSFEFKKIEDFKFFNFGAEHPVFYENFIKDEELFQDLKFFSRNIVI